SQARYPQAVQPGFGQGCTAGPCKLCTSEPPGQPGQPKQRGPHLPGRSSTRRSFHSHSGDPNEQQT
ncbi:hypothetical protein, partial [Staphylococcus aureus]|uniref:hypothetical protein n=1 Tax=Staphylococcus aureus TaxID=1280 RepID=UPI00158198F4